MRRARKSINQINVVPYIDVMLVLLVIFMVTAPLVTPGEIDALARWLAGVGPDIPLHLSRYFPRYRASGAPTDRRALFSLAEVARRHLNHVLVGNV